MRRLDETIRLDGATIDKTNFNDSLLYGEKRGIFDYIKIFIGETVNDSVFSLLITLVLSFTIGAHVSFMISNLIISINDFPFLILSVMIGFLSLFMMLMYIIVFRMKDYSTIYIISDSSLYCISGLYNIYICDSVYDLDSINDLYCDGDSLILSFESRNEIEIPKGKNITDEVQDRVYSID
jgi:hypothetical protein